MSSTSREIVIDVTTPRAAPAWALLERQLLDAQVARLRAVLRALLRRARLPAVRAALVRRRRPGRRARERAELDGAARARRRRPRPRAVQARRWKGTSGSTPRRRRPRSTLGRDGMYYQEFHACFDWFHHGEAWSAIFLQGLSDPNDRALVQRMRRWSSWYMGDDPHIPNYDKRAQGHPQLLQRHRAGRCCARRPRSTGPATRSRWRAASTPATARRPSRRCWTTSATTPTSSATTRQPRRDDARASRPTR